MEKALLHYRGLSSDGRTNKWQAQCCKCDTFWYPPTTLMGRQAITCPKCNTEQLADYNSQIDWLAERKR